jgi:hypothetical protein
LIAAPLPTNPAPAPKSPPLNSLQSFFGVYREW